MTRTVASRPSIPFRPPLLAAKARSGIATGPEPGTGASYWPGSCLADLRSYLPSRASRGDRSGSKLAFTGATGSFGKAPEPTFHRSGSGDWLRSRSHKAAPSGDSTYLYSAGRAWSGGLDRHLNPGSHRGKPGFVFGVAPFRGPWTVQPWDKRSDTEGASVVRPARIRPSSAPSATETCRPRTSPPRSGGTSIVRRTKRRDGREEGREGSRRGLSSSRAFRRQSLPSGPLPSLSALGAVLPLCDTFDC